MGGFPREHTQPGPAVTRPLRAAIVGFGVSGRVFHAPLLAANPDYTVEAIVTGNPERAAAARRRFPAARIVPDYASLLQLVDDGALALDLVVLGTPPAGHRAEALAAIQRGLHLVVDKPFAASAADAEAMIAAAHDAGTRLTVFQNRRWDADFLTLSRLVESGRLGRVRTFESRFEWWRPEGFGTWRDSTPAAEAGGLLFDLGSHLIDQALQLFGPVEEADAELRRHSGPVGAGADEDSFVTLRHASGVVSRLWMNGLAPAVGPRFHVLGSEAGFTSWGLDGQEPALDRGADPASADYGVVPPKNWGRLASGGSQEPVASERGCYPAFYRLLAAALRGEGPLPVDPEESLAVLRLIEHLHEQTSIRSTAETLQTART